MQPEQAAQLIAQETHRLPDSAHRFYQPPPLLDDPTPPAATYCPPCTLEANLCRPCQTVSDASHSSYQGIAVAGDPWATLASQAALASVQQGGGPFGAVILQLDSETNEVLRYWVNHNRVIINSDPTAHAEMNAIRAAASEMGVFHLGEVRQVESRLPQPGPVSRCVLYSSGEPCPMCLAAIYWAGIEALYFNSTVADAEAPGVDFSDAAIYEELAKPLAARTMRIRRSNVANALDAFNYYKRNDVGRYGEK